MVHAGAWAVVQVADGGWSSIATKASQDRFIASGIVGWLCLVLVLLLSLPPLRSAAYEVFLNVHIVLAFTVFSCAWIHCASAGIELPQLPWIVAAMALWLAERTARVVRLAFYNWSRHGLTTAVVEAMPGDTAVCRVTMHLPRRVHVGPGTHAYIRLATVRPWESHPFSIAWTNSSLPPGCLPVSEAKADNTSTAAGGTTDVSFVIAAQQGFTRSLFDAAWSQPGRRLHTRATIEGPYAGHHSLDSYGHLVLFAGGTGISHQLGLAAHVVRGVDAHTVAARRLLLVWTVREASSVAWVRPWLDAIWEEAGASSMLEVRVFVTGRPKAVVDVSSDDEVEAGGAGGMTMLPGRPDVMRLVKEEVRGQIGAMCVTVCGPGGLADDVRSAVRAVQDSEHDVDFVEESFSW